MLSLLVARLAYLALLCPYALVEDEAQYWEWSRHLSLSYYTKGPGIAWTIALATSLLGDSAFAVRASAPLFSALTSLAVAGLVLDLTRGDRRQALYAVGALQLAPLNQASALLGTIDGPYGACWAMACWAAWRALRGRSDAAGPGPRPAGWLLVGLALGVGFLFKYTILLLIPGLLAFALLDRSGRTGGSGPPEARPRHARWLLAGLLLGLLAASPVFIWNHQHGWPTLAHLLGHLGFAEPGAAVVPAPGTALAPAAALAPPATPGHWSPLWPLEFLGTQLGLIGPGLLLCLLAVPAAWRSRGPQRPDARAAAPIVPGGAFFLLCAGGPILVFYLLVSFFAEPEGNWPMAGYVTLLPLAGLYAAGAMADYRQRVARWLALPSPRPRAGFLRAKPETAGQILWHAALAYGLVSGVLMLGADLVGRVPGLEGVVPRARLAQGELLAQGVESLRRRVAGGAGPESPPLLIAAHYGRASQLAFYLPDRPVVMCASSRIGGRPTQHDYWPSHDLTRPELMGRSALLIGGDESTWSRAFDRLEPLGLVPGVERKNIHAFLGTGYRGL